MIPDDDVRDLQAAMAGKACRVIGAAPIPYPILRNGLTVIAVNGGIASVPAAKRGHPGAEVHVWVVNARTAQDAKSHQLYPTMIQQGRDRHVGLLVTFSKDEDDSCRETLVRLAKQGTTWDAHVDLNNSTRRRIECLGGARLPSEVQGNTGQGPMTKHALSAGLAAVCLAFWAGAASVTLEGFSWEPGYSYPTPYPVPHRGHIAGDQLGLARLQAQYEGRLFHTLRLPPFQESDMARERNPHIRRMNRRARLGEVVPEYAGPLPRMVIATAEMVYYSDKRWRRGERFPLRDPKHFKASHMRDVWVAPDAPPPAPLPSAIEEGEKLADQISGRGPARRQRRGPVRAVDVQQQLQDHEQLTGAGSRSVL